MYAGQEYWGPGSRPQRDVQPRPGGGRRSGVSAPFRGGGLLHFQRDPICCIRPRRCRTVGKVARLADLVTAVTRAGTYRTPPSPAWPWPGRRKRGSAVSSVLTCDCVPRPSCDDGMISVAGARRRRPPFAAMSRGPVERVMLRRGDVTSAHGPTLAVHGKKLIPGEDQLCDLSRQDDDANLSVLREGHVDLPPIA